MDFVGNSYNGYQAKAEIWKEAAEEFRDYLCDRGFNAIMERVKLHN